MKKLIFIALTLLLASNAMAWWTLVDCQYGQGPNYQYGYTGLYRNSQGQYYKMFFGNQYCPTNLN